MDYKTPGVFIKEVSTFPPSVAAVSTAIPAFVGYTENIVDAKGESLLYRPIRISSFPEFREVFGGPFIPADFLVTVADSGTPDAATVTAVQSRDAGSNIRKFYLYQSMELYYGNGGGPCYIVSVGDYSNDIEYNVENPPASGNFEGLRPGLDAVQRLDEPTILVFPDAVGIVDGAGAPDPVVFGQLQQDALAQSAKLQDRFVVMDLIEGFREAAVGVDPIGDFRNRIGTNALLYGAAYYPWLRTTFQQEVSIDALAFQDDGGVPLTDLDLGALSSDAAINALYEQTVGTQADKQAVVDTMTATVAGLTINNFSPLRAYYDALVDTFQSGASATRTQFTDIIVFLRATAFALQTLDTATLSTGSAVATRIDELKSDSSLIIAITDLIRLEKNPSIMSDIMLPSTGLRDTTDVDADYGALDSTDWVDADQSDAVPVTIASLVLTPETTIDVSVPTTIQAKGNVVLAEVVFIRAADKLIATLESVFNLAGTAEADAEAALFASHPFFQSVQQEIQNSMNMLPPSGAMAGIYAAVDRTRGVWKAPANVSVNGIVGPVVKITNQDQGDMNIHPTGKTVNAIRAFAGKGTLVWGARTLAGNDNEWRYIPVRRFFNFAEESIKKATEAFVFEPNNANTWVRIRGMIENFLTLQWRAGALAGAVPSDAFFVKVGLNETMTAQDILEGRLIVEIGMAAVRPAEFIILRFSHKMQEN